MKAVQILTPEQFRAIFRQVLESANPDSDPVLAWYMTDGMKILSRLSWSEAMAEELGVSHPDEDDPEYSRKVNVYLDALDDCTSEQFKNAAAKVISDSIGQNGFAFAGQGIMKVTFVDKFGHALKIGREGGEVGDEISISQEFPNFECFPKMLAYAPDKTSYMCECARTASESDFKRLFSMNNAIEVVEKCLRRDSCAEFNRKFKETKLLKWKSLADLSKFLTCHKLNDIDHEDNWGVIVRSGQETLTVIDYDM